MKSYKNNVLESLQVQGGRGWALQYKLVQVALDNHVLNGIHGVLQQICVGRIRVVYVDLLVGLMSHEASEFVPEK